MSTIVLPFSPSQDAITYIAVTTASNPTLLNGAYTASSSMELINRGTVEVFLKFGESAATIAVANTGYILRANDRIVISRPYDNADGWYWVAAICASGTANIVVVLGEGS